ncbi:MAG: hypothetical protein KAF40_01450 [Flavihumibacter sp.]|nr:hypothetical protein [Flavihumibacter sp.]
MFELSSEFQAICEYLEMIGYEKLSIGKEGQTWYGNNDYRVCLTSNFITIEQSSDDHERGQYWNVLARLEIRFIMELSQFVGFMDSIGVIPYAKMLGKVADHSKLEDKRALYHIREALKKTAHEIS